MVRRLLVAAFAGVTALSALILASSSSSSTIDLRQSNFKRLLSLDRSVRAEIQKADADPKSIERTALEEGQLARQIPSWFPPGSANEGASYARPEIWANPADFRAKASDLAQGFANLAQAARSGQLERIRAAEAGIGGRCQACHRSYMDRF